MNRKSIETLNSIKQCGVNMLKVLVSGQVSSSIYSQKAFSMVNLINSIPTLIPASIYQKYSDFFSSFSIFCSQCGNSDFLTNNVDTMASSLQLFVECMDDMIQCIVKKLRKCPCCRSEVIYMPISNYYSDMQKKFGINDVIKSETLNEEEYTCPVCGASDRDRLIISFLKKERLQEATIGTKLLQIAPAKVITNWITSNCPQITYETTDLFMDNVSYHSDIQNMDMVPNEAYDIIICSHVLEHVQDDRKALSELKRILKPDGKIIFLVPINLNSSYIDEAWGLSGEENWRRFGQGDHCRLYDKKGLIQRLKEHFCVHCLDKSYFGDEIFFHCGLTDTSTLYVLTKSPDVSLYLAQEFAIDENLCQNGPLVSVILPCYNHEQFVAEAIESVLNQSYQNIELLVMDDASTDNTAEVMKKYSSYFAKEIYFKENTGARIEYLYSYAKGKYIALMHSDDIWDKNKLAIQVAYMEEHEECGACLTWCLYTNENLEELNEHIFFQPNRSSYEWMRHFWSYGNAVCNPSSLIRSEIVLEKIKYGRCCRQVPDLFKYIDIIQRTSLHIIPKVLIRMRRYQKKGQENTSAISEENFIRQNFETGFNWLYVIRDMDTDFFKHTFHDLMINPQADSEVEIQCEKYFLLLNHSDIFIQHSAFCYFHEIYNVIEDCLIEKYHYSRNDFYKDTVNKGIGGAVSSLIKQN